MTAVKHRGSDSTYSGTKRTSLVLGRYIIHLRPKAESAIGSRDIQNGYLGTTDRTRFTR